MKGVIEIANRLEIYRERLLRYYQAEESILSGAQSYRIGSREFTRGDLKEVREAIRDLENRVDIEESRAAGRGRNKITGIIPRDY